MDPEFAGASLVGILAASAACGAVGGIAFDLTEPVHPRGKRRTRTGTAPPAVDDAESDGSFGDNRVAMPRRIKVRGRVFWEFGFLGPMFIGTIAALIAVSLLAVNRPDAPGTIELGALHNTLQAHDVTAKTITAVDATLKTRTPFVQWDRLIAIALIGGFAGIALLRVARSRLLTAMRQVAFEARTAGMREGASVSATAAADAATNPAVESVPREAESALTSAINSAVEEHIQELAQSNPHGDPQFA
jgi:hypothetical protein